MRRLMPSFLALLAVAGATPAVAQEEDVSWPRAIEADGWVVTLYQPQVDAFVDNRLEGRAAVSVRRAEADSEPIFGAVWLSATVEIDRAARAVTVREVAVPSVRFVDSEQDDRDRLAALLEREIPAWEIVLDLDLLIASLDGDTGLATTPGLRNEPPRFVYRSEPAVLLLYDGEPEFRALPGGGDVERAINTPFPVLRDGRGALFLYGGESYWYAAAEATGPWWTTSDVPEAIRDAVKDVAAPEEFAAGDDEDAGDVPPPEIVVATTPTELIVTRGEPRWKPVGALDLLYLDNTDSDVFLDITSQLYYVLASGRWYAGTAVEDRFEWDHVPNDEVPESFSDIDPESVNGHVLAHVSGTTQAREEALANSIPQTAAVKRDDTSFAVRYDGDPVFADVEGAAGVTYAINTSSSVFGARGAYWACDNAIWYTAPAPVGPWTVATEIPATLYDVPPSNPHHNVTYVRIYETTPRVVYVGYTPGYVGSYWYRGCVVWGTGWYYDPWYGPHYYPRPWTWGLNVHYNPWYGWSFGLSWSNGPFSISLWSGGSYGPRYGHGWYGPGGYRPPYHRPYPPPGYSKPRPTPYRPPTATRPGAGGPTTRPATNIYDRPATRDRVASTAPARDRARPARLDAPNDVLTDRAGNVYRPGPDGGWDRRENGQWRPAEGLDRPTARPGTPSGPTTRPATPTRPSTRPATPTRPSTRPATPSRPSTRPSTRPGGSTRPQLERDMRSRQRGSQRIRSRPTMPRPSPRATPRGGGRRR